MSFIKENFDIFIAYYGNMNKGTEALACDLYDKLQGRVFKNGKKLNVFCFPKTSPNEQFSETPRIVARTPLFLLLVDKDIPVDDNGQIQERHSDRTLRYLYQEMKAFRESEWFKRADDGTAAKLLICDQMSSADVNKLDPMFSGTRYFRWSDNTVDDIFAWIEDSLDPYDNRGERRELEELALIRELKRRNISGAYLKNIYDAFELCFKELKKINILFNADVDHSISHSLRMLRIMGKLLERNLNQLTNTEITVLIMAALFHDIGMVVEQDDIDELVRSGRSADYQSDLVLNNISKNIFCGDVNKAVTYIFKRIKDQRMRSVIERMEAENLFVGMQGNYLEDVLILCNTRTQSFEDAVSKFICNKTVAGEELDQVYLACILHLAEILDFDLNSTLSEYGIFSYPNLPSDIQQDFPRLILSNAESKIRRSTKDYTRKCGACDNILMEVYLQSASFDEVVRNCGRDFSIEEYDDIQCRIIEYKETLERTLRTCKYVLKRANSRHIIELEDQVEYFSAEERTPNHRIDIDYSTTVSLLLGEQIYGNKQVGLREIVQNSLDACKYRYAKRKKIIGCPPTIWIELDRDHNQVRITDNGIGMNRFVLENYFLKIGKSLYGSKMYLESNAHFKHAGHFGIGFFAAFMLSDHVEIHTRHVDEKDSWNVRVSTNGRYASISKSSQIYDIGTSIILNYREFEQNFNVYRKPNFDSFHEIKNYLAHYFLADITEKIKVSIVLMEGDVEESISVKSLTERLDTNKNDRVVDLSGFFDGINCLLRVEDRNACDWYMYERDETGERFSRVSVDAFSQTKKIVYKKIIGAQGSVYVYIPEKYWERDQQTGIPIAPFDYDGLDRQCAFVARTERVFGSITIFDFYRLLGWEFPSMQQPIMGYVGEFFVASVDSNIAFYQKDIGVARREPSHSITLNGNQCQDRIYVRNVCIPDFHMELPRMLVMLNGKMVPEIKEIVMNIEKEGVFPNIDRNDMPIPLKKEISEAVGIAIFRWLKQEFEADVSFDKIIENTFGTINNRFLEGQL